MGTLTTGQSAVLTITASVTLRSPHANTAVVYANVQTPTPPIAPPPPMSMADSH
ncbi:MAG: hypothetical protein WCP58_09760 [bacterium]